MNPGGLSPTDIIHDALKGATCAFICVSNNTNRLNQPRFSPLDIYRLEPPPKSISTTRGDNLDVFPSVFVLNPSFDQFGQYMLLI